MGLSKKRGTEFKPLVMLIIVVFFIFALLVIVFTQVLLPILKPTV